MKFYQKIHQLRTRKNLSQENLAEALSVSRQTIAKWETGKAYPEIEKLILIGNYFGLSLDALIKDSGCADTRLCPDKTQAPHEQVIAFLLCAKQNAYAAQCAEDTPCRPASHDWRFERAPFTYLDSYFGGELFSGQEVVYEHAVPIWAMNYIGRILHGSFSIDFLKDVLLLGTPELPYRGPLLYSKGQYTYHNRITGDFQWYEGFEEIYFSGEKVYECRYHGGVLV